jgi:hypothetical protein
MWMVSFHGDAVRARHRRREVADGVPPEPAADGVHLQVDRRARPADGGAGAARVLRRERQLAVDHVVSVLAQDSGSLRTSHGRRLVVLYGRGVAALEVAARGAVL